MPFYAKGNMRAWVAAQQGVAAAESPAVRARVHEIFSAVAFLHQNFIVHCDLKVRYTVIFYF
jgi:hypothetical protein